MTLDLGTAAPGGLGEAGVKTPAGREAIEPSFDRAVVDRHQLPQIEGRGGEEQVRREPTAEVFARTGQGGNSLGHQVLDRLDAIQQAGRTLRLGRHDAPAANEPTLKVAARLPGPAEAHLAPATSNAAKTQDQVQADQKQDVDARYEQILQRMDQSNAYLVQANVLSKTTGSFSQSLNKLISSS